MFTTTEASVTLAIMKAGGTVGAVRPLGKIVGLLALVIPLILLITLKWLHEPKIRFRQVSIVSQSPDEPAATLARMAREDAALVGRAHTELIALTMLALALLCFLLTMRAPKWTKYMVVTSAVVSVAACWSQW